MTRLKLEPKTLVSIGLTLVMFISGAAWQNARAQAASAPSDGAALAPNRPAVLSPTLSYYFISGNTFSADEGPATYGDRLGCRWGMTQKVAFTAPVHLPQASVVVSMTLYTYFPGSTPNIAQASFIVNNGLGFEHSTLYVTSAPFSTEYQQQETTVTSTTTIDNQAYSYFVSWWESGINQPTLGVCGVRLAYYAPASGVFLPAIER